MRVGTLNDESTLSFLREHFVLVAHNQLPELYCHLRTIDATNSHSYSSEQVKHVTEGVGGGNVRSFFCTPDGRVVSYVSGYWKSETYLAEARWALERIRKWTQSSPPASDPQSNGQSGLGPETLVTRQAKLEWIQKDHQKREAEYVKKRDDFASPDQVQKLLALVSADPNSKLPEKEKDRRATLFNRIAAFNRLIRSHREAQSMVGQPVRNLLQKIEDEVYTKGNIGCDS